MYSNNCADQSKLQISMTKAITQLNATQTTRPIQSNLSPVHFPFDSFLNQIWNYNQCKSIVPKYCFYWPLFQVVITLLSCDRTRSPQTKTNKRKCFDNFDSFDNFGPLYVLQTFLPCFIWTRPATSRPKKLI